MSSALTTSVTALNAYNEQLSIISNNIANTGTTSYKSSSVSFKDLLNQSLSASAVETSGAGVSINNISTSWTQGSTSSTSVTTDLEIDGSGFFIVKDESGNGANYYTRNGEFEFNKNNILVNSDGYSVQGYTLDSKGNLGTLGNIEVSYTATSPVATSKISTSVSLNSALTSGNTFTTTTEIYDSLGNEIPLTIIYTKSATNNEWTWGASISSSYGTLSGTSTGTLTFNSDGTLASGTNPTFDLTLTNGATSPQSISWNIYDTSGTTNGSLKQYSGDCVLNNQSQNGSASVSLSSIAINSKGVVVGSYSDGSNKNLYQLSLANFNNYDGLKDAGNSLYQATVTSGDPVIGTAGSGQLGTILSSSLESSNVNLTSELANLVTAERAYEAAARVFSVADEIMQTTVKMS